MELNEADLLVQSIHSVVIKEDGSADPVTRIIGIFFHIFDIAVDVALLSQVSFSLHDVVLRTDDAIHWSFGCHLCEGILNKPDEEIMGMYFVSSLLSIKKSLATGHRMIITDVLGGDIQFDFHRRWSLKHQLSSLKQPNRCHSAKAEVI